jgi:hypothetical protein
MLKETDCKIRQRNLCKVSTCEMCFYRSLASVEKSDQFDISHNNLYPRELVKGCNEKFHFKCSKCNHNFIKAASSFLISDCGFCKGDSLCADVDCKTCFVKSFASHEKSRYWSSEKNSTVPRMVSKGSGKKFWFDCNDCKHSFCSNLSNITCDSTQRWCSFCSNKQLCDDLTCLQCHEKSFNSHPNSKLWHPIKNNPITPRQIFRASHAKYWFACKTCNHDYFSSVSGISKFPNMSKCPYCSNTELCNNLDCQECNNKSFASNPKSKFWSTSNELHPRYVFLHSNNKFWFDCGDCRHVFCISLNVVSNAKCPSWCPYCSQPPKLLCDSKDCTFCEDKSFASHSQAKLWHKTKNGHIQPRSIFKHTATNYWFSCDKCLRDFEGSPNNLTRSEISSCPFCYKKTESLIYDFLTNEFPEVIREAKFDWAENKRFDFYLPDYRLLIELDGEAHFQDIEYWKSFVIDCVQNDCVKMNLAIKNRYSVIRIYRLDIWFADKLTYDWQTKLKAIIGSMKLGYLMTPSVFYFSIDQNVYNAHKSLMG